MTDSSALLLACVFSFAPIASAEPPLAGQAERNQPEKAFPIEVSVEASSGVMLFDSSRVALDPRFLAGARLSGQPARGTEIWRRIFFIDVGYWWSATADGTSTVSVVASRHFVSIAPALAFPLRNVPLQFYVQAGAGVLVAVQAIRAATETSISSASFLFQYGGGIRFQPQLGKVAASFRLEVTRFLRNSVHDTLFAATGGLTF